MKLAICAAFPQELKYILKNFSLKKSLKRDVFHIFFGEFSSQELILVQTGIGVQNAEAALNYILETERPDLIVSAGFGGALYEGASSGDLVWAKRALLFPEGDLNILEFPNDFLKTSLGFYVETGICDGSILTLSRWMAKSDIIKILPAGLPHPVCDMETYPLAKLSLNNGLPFLAVRSITDTIDEDIPKEFFAASNAFGQYSFSRALGMLLSRPSLIPHSFKLGRASEIASKNLWHAVRHLIKFFEK
jgi:adenosylhomocysteine nucleosidase